MSKALPVIAENQMKATYKSLLLASTVVGFEIVELWSDEGDGLSCTYVYVDKAFSDKFPEVVSTPFPEHSKAPTQSPFLCSLAKEAIEDRCFWITSEAGKPNDFGLDYKIGDKNGEPVFLTQMAYLLKKSEEEGGSGEFYIVGYSYDKVECKPSFLKFLSGLGYAIYVAAYDIDENVNDDNVETITHHISKFAPDDKDYGYHYNDSTHSKYSVSSSEHSKGEPAELFQTSNFIANNAEHHNKHPIKTTGEASLHNPNLTNAANLASLLPPFIYNYNLIPVKIELQLNLEIGDFQNVQHIADGSNANIFTANFKGSFIVIKMIKEACQEDEVAINELDMEIGLLSRMEHPNIIRVIGGGSAPRKFIVMEHLGGGSLHSVLQSNPQKPGLASKLFFKPTWAFGEFLILARDLASSLDYLHERCHKGASILHRDLKPENIGLTKDGKLKLFDFGLASCVRSRTKQSDAYEMTGYTGSLRYMAPEVVLEENYTEKVDVYSFAIVLWQCGRDKVPFKGLNKDQFTEKVVNEGLRPKMDKRWPAAFCTLLASCWDRDPLKRPSFATVIVELDKLIDVHARGHHHKGGSAPGGDKKSASSWF